MKPRDVLWTAAQLGLASLFLLMGIYSGELPLGLMTAGLLTAGLAGRTSALLLRVRAADALRSTGRERGLSRRLVRGYNAVGWGLVAVLLVLALTGRPGSALSAVISIYVALWLVGLAVAIAGRLVLRVPAALR